MWKAACAIAALVLTGCVSIPLGRYDIADDIAEDHAALNDAYGRAVNNEILLNVLRSRDRWPRHYTNVKEIVDQPTLTNTQSFSLAPLGFNNAANPYRNSNFGLQRQDSIRPSYGVQPLSTEAIGRAVLSPTRRSVFAHYWNSGWPRDILLLVMAANISETTGPRLTETEVQAVTSGHAPSTRSWQEPLRNTGEALATGCPANDTSSGCGFYRLVGQLQSFDAHVTLRPPPARSCRRSSGVNIDSSQAALLQSMANAAADDGISLELAAPREGAPAQLLLVSCTPQGEQAVVLEYTRDSVTRTYLVELRSLDAMVYAMGELIRVNNGDVPLVRPPDCPSPCSRLTTLFRVIEEREQNDAAFAAVVSHVDRKYLAGSVVRTGDDAGGDRTATVLTLLTQLFAINHSPGELASVPARPVID